MAFAREFDQVLEAARAGAEWALTAMFRELHPKVLRYLRSQEPGHADDIASPAWLDVVTGLHRFRGGEDDFRKWVFTIARRRLLDQRRASGRLRRSAAAGSGPEPTGDVEVEAMANLSTEAAIARIGAILPKNQAEIVLLRVIAGLSVKQVAAIVGKRTGAVRVLQHRALARLAEALSREEVTH
jgi:RNA polymerase sigma-70 factor, ECF subfamily